MQQQSSDTSKFFGITEYLKHKIDKVVVDNLDLQQHMAHDLEATEKKLEAI